MMIEKKGKYFSLNKNPEKNNSHFAGKNPEYIDNKSKEIIEKGIGRKLTEDDFELCECLKYPELNLCKYINSRWQRKHCSANRDYFSDCTRIK